MRTLKRGDCEAYSSLVTQNASVNSTLFEMTPTQSKLELVDLIQSFAGGNVLSAVRLEFPLNTGRPTFQLASEDCGLSVC